MSKAPTISRRRKARAQISKEDLLTQLKRCEELLERHGVSVEDELEGGVMETGGGRGMSVKEESRSPESVATDNMGKLIIERGHSRYIENDLWSELGEEVRLRLSIVVRF
jgi:hypothetical protein